MRTSLATLALLGCAASPPPTTTKPPPPETGSVADATAPDAMVEASLVEAGPSSALNCDSPRVRDTVTLACTDHAPCPVGQDLADGACVPSCSPARPVRLDGGTCGCPAGTTDVNEGEIGGCLRPSDLDFGHMCTQPHEHFDGSIVPQCKCDSGYVRAAGPTVVSWQCVRPCSPPLAYDRRTDRCGTCPGQEAVGRVCAPPCPPMSKRDATSGECRCQDGMFIDNGQCVHCSQGRSWDAATKQCTCPTGTEDWGYEGCLPACASGTHRFNTRCDADCPTPSMNDAATGSCRACDTTQNAFAFTTHGRSVCVQCSFDEVLDKAGRCTCRPGFRSANGHCVSP